MRVSFAITCMIPAPAPSAQHYELYDVAKDKYQMHNIYSQASAQLKASLHAELDEYWRCGSPVDGAIGVGMLPSGKSNCV